MNSITGRLKKLESYLPRPIIVLCRMSDGSEREMTVDEFTETGAIFIRVVRGNNLADVDKILEAVDEECAVL